MHYASDALLAYPHDKPSHVHVSSLVFLLFHLLGAIRRRWTTIPARKMGLENIESFLTACDAPDAEMTVRPLMLLTPGLRQRTTISPLRSVHIAFGGPVPQPSASIEMSVSLASFT